jgi:hypothetical protein
LKLLAFSVAERVETAQAATPHGWYSLCLAVVAADRDGRHLYELINQLEACETMTVALEIRKSPPSQTDEGFGARVLLKNRRRQVAIEGADIAGKFREAQIHHAVQLPHLIAEILYKRASQARELFQVLGCGVNEFCSRRLLLSRKAGEAERVDAVGLGLLQLFGRKSAGSLRFKERYAEAVRHQSSERICQ